MPKNTTGRIRVAKSHTPGSPFASRSPRESAPASRPRRYEGGLVADKSWKIAVVASRFNETLSEQLINGALWALRRHGVSDSQISVVIVPGAWEIPLACRRLIRGAKVHAVVALGVVIRGATPHFETIVAESASGIARLMTDSGVPISMGIISAENVEQAQERAGGKLGNKGSDAALAVLDMLSVADQLSADGM